MRASHRLGSKVMPGEAVIVMLPAMCLSETLQLYDLTDSLLTAQSFMSGISTKTIQ